MVMERRICVGDINRQDFIWHRGKWSRTENRALNKNKNIMYFSRDDCASRRLLQKWIRSEVSEIRCLTLIRMIEMFWNVHLGLTVWPFIRFEPIFFLKRSVIKQKRPKDKQYTLSPAKTEWVVFAAIQSPDNCSGLRKNWDVWNFAPLILLATMRPFIDASVGIHKLTISANDFHCRSRGRHLANCSPGNWKRQTPQNSPREINSGVWMCVSTHINCQCSNATVTHYS